jgi:long-chain acyl-CoA synthetase
VYSGNAEVSSRRGAHVAPWRLGSDSSVAFVADPDTFISGSPCGNILGAIGPTRIWASGKVTTFMDLEDLTIPALFKRSVDLYGSLPALALVGERPITYAEVDRRSEDLAGRLRNRGIRRGQTVAILGENSPQWVLAYLAVVSIGAVAVPILPGFPDADIRHIIRNSEAVAVFTSARQRPTIEGPEMAGVRTIFSLEDFSTQNMVAERGLADRAKDMLHKVGERARVDAEPGAALSGPAADDLAVVIYTSGTTGHSKGVMLTHRNIVSDVISSIEKFPIDSRDRFISLLPLSHTFEATGGLLCPLAVGVSIYYIKGLPTPKRLLTAMQTVKPTGFLAVPLIMDKVYRTQVLRKVKARGLDRLCRIAFLRKLVNRVAGRKLVRAFGGHLRFMILGGAAMSEDLEVFLQDAGIAYSTGYGMTEASPILAITPFGSPRTGSCGQPIPCVEMKIFEPDSATGVGEIIVRGPNVMKGYYKNPEATRAAFLEGRWLRTGDLGCLDGDGYLCIKGRSKNVIVGPSGENVYPELIEQKLARSPYVQQAIAYQDGGNLLARVYLDQDVLDQEFEHGRLGEQESRVLRDDLLERIRAQVNTELPVFSRLQRILEQPEPFELTPTRKIKRYLYTR